MIIPLHLRSITSNHFVGSMNKIKLKGIDIELSPLRNGDVRPADVNISQIYFKSSKHFTEITRILK